MTRVRRSIRCSAELARVKDADASLASVIKVFGVLIHTIYVGGFPLRFPPFLPHAAIVASRAGATKDAAKLHDRFGSMLQSLGELPTARKQLGGGTAGSI